MNRIKLKGHKFFLKDVWHNFDGAQEVIYERVEEIWSNKNLSTEKVIYFIYENLFSVFSFLLVLKMVVWHKLFVRVNKYFYWSLPRFKKGICFVY